MYFGSMNGLNHLKLKIPLAFLERDKQYVAHIYSDADPGDGTRTHVQINRYLVDSTILLDADMLPSGGQAIRIVPATAEDIKTYSEHQKTVK